MVVGENDLGESDLDESDLGVHFRLVTLAQRLSPGDLRSFTFARVTFAGSFSPGLTFAQAFFISPSSVRHVAAAAIRHGRAFSLWE